MISDPFGIVSSTSALVIVKTIDCNISPFSELAN